jgi:hypothetical protein
MVLLRNFMPFEFMFMFLIWTVTNNAFMAAISCLNVRVISGDRRQKHLPHFLTTFPTFCLRFLNERIFTSE